MTQYKPIPRGREGTVGYVLKMPRVLKETLVEQAEGARIPVKDLILTQVSDHLSEADYSAFMNDDGVVETATLFLRIPHEVHQGLRDGARCESISIRALLVRILSEALEEKDGLLRE